DACPFKVEFADFIRELRIGRDDYADVRGGIIRLYARKQAASKTPMSWKVRHGWLDKSLEVNGSSEIAVFAGCLALFDAISGPSCEESFGGMAKAAVRLLNRLGVSPIVLEDERCCGRDLFDIGEREAFEALARHNVAEIGKSKAKKVLTICPECAFTLKDTYAKSLGEMPFEVQHISEYLAKSIDALDFRTGEERFAFHDPCYLCRYLGVSEAPRKILAALSSRKPVELDRTGSAAPCCGAGSWVNHGPHTRTAVDERLKEAARCGADVLVTACPKCTLLYSEVSPACSWKQSPVVARDLITLAAARLKE
ncbi:MAG: (Fe-S)-binding protein, partial [Candidatus Krumholzibacteria bacterium]|nr:(Fe-S)-binding protein [Candidatus Krumholzibacteria bacterium]